MLNDIEDIIDEARTTSYTGYKSLTTSCHVYSLYFIRGELHNPAPLFPAYRVWISFGGNLSLCNISFFEHGNPVNASSTLPHAVTYMHGGIDQCIFVDDEGKLHDPMPGLPAVLSYDVLTHNGKSEIQEEHYYSHGIFLYSI